ncbi:MAG: hypothetical protein U1A78_33575 [Polyangia bacterium]
MRTLTPNLLVKLEAAAENGCWDAMRELPMELWPWPLTTAMQETLRNLPADQKQTLLTLIRAQEGAEGHGS